MAATANSSNDSHLANYRTIQISDNGSPSQQMSQIMTQGLARPGKDCQHSGWGGTMAADTLMPNANSAVDQP